MRKFIAVLILLPIISFASLSSVVIVKIMSSQLTNPDSTKGMAPELKSSGILDSVEFVLAWTLLVVTVAFVSTPFILIIWGIAFAIAAPFYKYIYCKGKT